MNIILVGFMGTGKTMVGRRLARKIGWSFVDVDRQIEAAAGMTIPEIFAQRGEAEFRKVERSCVSEALRADCQVIATGGGAFVDKETRSRLKAGGKVVCLHARPEVILKRVGRRLAARPMLAGSSDPLESIRGLLQDRLAAYAKAHMTIDTSDVSVDHVVKELTRVLKPKASKQRRPPTTGRGS